jgi:nucleotide-binding universal stress UspA family protein
VRPFGDPEGIRAWRRRLYREPVPPRARKPDCPPWLQEIILRCLEIDPDRRYPTAAQLAFDLQHPDQVELTTRSTRTTRNGLLTAAGRWINSKRNQVAVHLSAAKPRDTAPIVLAAVDLTTGSEELAEELRIGVQRILHMHPGARLACVNVLKQSRIAIDKTEDEQGRNLHLRRLAELQYWAKSLPVPAHGVTFHVFEAVDPATAIVDYARNNHVDHIVIGARASSALRRYLGSVSSQVVAQAPCTVTVVRRRQQAISSLAEFQ